MLLILCCLLLNVIDGLPLAKLHDTSMSFGGISLVQMPNSDLMSQIMSSKDNEEVLLSVLSDADPAQLNQVITLLKGLLATSRTELAVLTTSSGNADTAFNDAVAAHNAALVAQTNGQSTLQTTKENAIRDANATYDQGVTALQSAVDAAKGEVDSTNSTKITANALLAADQARLNSEINTLITVIALMEGVLGINTVSPTSSPTTAPTSSPTTAPTSSPTITAVTAVSYAGEYEVWYAGGKRSTNLIIRCDNTVEQPGLGFNDRLHFDIVSSGQCNYDRDAQATMYILKTHGANKFECLFQEGTTLKGHHYLNTNDLYGEVEYRLITQTTC